MTKFIYSLCALAFVFASGQVFATCGAGSIYGLLQVGAAGDGSTADSDPNFASTGTETAHCIGKPTDTVSWSVGSSNGLHKCQSYHNGTSWVTDTRYSGNTMTSRYFMILNSADAKPARIPTSMALNGTPSTGTKYTAELIYPSSDTNNYYTCVDDSGAYFWKVCFY